MKEEKNGNGRSDKELTVIIETTAGIWNDPPPTFEKTAKVSDVITAVINKFGFDPNGNFKLKLKRTGEILEPNRPLVSYGIKDGDILVFTDIGGGA